MPTTLITTQTGTEYRYDDEARIVSWGLPDGTPRQYTAITAVVLEKGYRFVFAGTRDIDGKPNARSTTPVVSIEVES